MAAKSTTTPATPKARTRRKPKSVKVITNVVASIVFINPEIRKQQANADWSTALRRYVDTLSNDEVTLVKKVLAFTLAKPKNREYLHGPCPVIPFPIQNKRIAAQEAQ